MSDTEAAKAWATDYKIDAEAMGRLFEEGFNVFRLLDPDDLPK